MAHQISEELRYKIRQGTLTSLECSLFFIYRQSTSVSANKSIVSSVTYFYGFRNASLSQYRAFFSGRTIGEISSPLK